MFMLHDTWSCFAYFRRELGRTSFLELIVAVKFFGWFLELMLFPCAAAVCVRIALCYHAGFVSMHSLFIN